MSASTGPGPVARPSGESGFAAVLALYTLARLGLVAVVAALLAVAGTPLVVAVLVALVVALPLSMVLFRGLRTRLDEALAVSRARRGAERAVLRARLRGEEPREAEGDPASSGDRSQHQADGGGG